MLQLFGGNYKKYKELFYNNFNLIISSSLLSVSTIIFCFSSIKFISVIILIFLYLILFFTLQDKLSHYKNNKKIKKEYTQNNFNEIIKNKYLNNYPSLYI